VQTYTGHKHPIFAVEYVDRGNLVASCDNTIHVWDMERGSRKILFEQSESTYTCFAPIDDGRALVSGTALGTINFSDLRTRSETCEWKLPSNQSGQPKCICIDTATNIVAVGQNTGYITLIDLKSGLLLHTWRAHDGHVAMLKAHAMHDNHFIVSCSNDRSLVLWNITKSLPMLEKTFKGHRDPIQSFDFHNNDLLSVAGHKLAAGSLESADSVVTLQRMRMQKSSLKPNQLTTINVLHNHQLILIGSEDGNIKCCY